MKKKLNKKKKKIELKPHEAIRPSEKKMQRMIEEFIATASTRPPRPIVDRSSIISIRRRQRSFGRPRLIQTKTVTMLKDDDGTLRRAGRGRPSANQSRVKVSVSWNDKVIRGIRYKLTKEGKLEKIT